MTESTTAVSSLVGLPAVGSLIADKFRLEELIGEGGQAWIWRARHIELDSEVALKILRSANAGPTQIERLRKEARAVARLNHPSIIRVFDLGETQQGNPYLVMEHLEGEDLATSLSRTGKIAPIEAVRLLLPIAGAVAAVHAIGIVHRDLKPDNIFLARNAQTVQPKLLDFGVAKHDITKNRQIKLTEVGAVLGSPAYLSPEQARGQADVDSRADIWSFCAMLYECVTGTLPFHASNTHALLFSIAEDDPLSLGDHGIEEEEELWRILRRGLEKSSVDRWPNMRSLGRALAQWLSDRGVTSDIAGVVLDSTWFNPDIVTPPPISAQRTESSGSDAPAWTKRSGAASHVECRTPVAAAQPKKHPRRLALALTFLVGVGATVFLLTGTDRGAHALRALQRASNAVSLRPAVLRAWQHASNAIYPSQAGSRLAAMPLKRTSLAPGRLAVEQLARGNAAVFPALPTDLLPLPVVPVEKLRLVSGPGSRTPNTFILPLAATPSPVSGSASALAATTTAPSTTVAPKADPGTASSAASKSD